MLKHRLRTLGLTLTAALSLMALFAIGAQAENLKTGGVLGLFTSSLGFPHTITGVLEHLTGSALVHGVLLVPGRNLSVLCSAGHVTQGQLLNQHEGLGVFEFLECLSYNLAGTTHLSECIIDDINKPGANDRTILAHAKFLPRLHEDLATHTQKLYLLVDIASATILYEKGTGCSLPHKNEVTGNPVCEATDVGAKKETEWLVTCNEAIQKLFLVNLGGTPPTIHGDRCFFGAFDCYIDANSIVTSLTGSALFGIV